MAGFYDYVRGLSDELPPGHSRQGMEVYRHLVRLGVEQQVQARHPGLRDQLTEAMGEPAWEALITGFIQQSAWTSHFYGDLSDEFDAFIARQAGAGDTHEHAA
jgi:hypothetical protein